jgi:hypothetical protein
MASAKIIVSRDGEVLREVALSNDRTTIGRRPYNDIVLDNAAISGEHAVIATVLHDNILEDLNSTNGTFVNGQPVKKHFLQNNDVIELVKFQLRYLDAAHADHIDAGSITNANNIAAMSTDHATLRVLNGSNAGTSLALTKDVTTLGRAGAQVVAITRRPDAYVIASVEGPSPLVNFLSIGMEEQPLVSGDVIDLSGTQIEFSCL